jgi:hypothetical protein
MAWISVGAQKLAPSIIKLTTDSFEILSYAPFMDLSHADPRPWAEISFAKRSFSAC